MQLVEQCPQEEEQREQSEDADYGGGNDLVEGMGIVKSAQCIKVPAMRCKIEKVEVMKSKPETKCTRVPREFCRKEACVPDDGPEECYFRNKVVSDGRQSTLWGVHSVVIFFRVFLTCSIARWADTAATGNPNFKGKTKQKRLSCRPTVYNGCRLTHP